MAKDTITGTATITDKASGPLSKIEKALLNLEAVSGKADEAIKRLDGRLAALTIPKLDTSDLHDISKLAKGSGSSGRSGRSGEVPIKGRSSKSNADLEDAWAKKDLIRSINDRRDSVGSMVHVPQSDQLAKVSRGLQTDGVSLSLYNSNLTAVANTMKKLTAVNNQLTFESQSYAIAVRNKTATVARSIHTLTMIEWIERAYAEWLLKRTNLIKSGMDIYRGNQGGGGGAIGGGGGYGGSVNRGNAFGNNQRAFPSDVSRDLGPQGRALTTTKHLALPNPDRPIPIVPSRFQQIMGRFTDSVKNTGLGFRSALASAGGKVGGMFGRATAGVASAGSGMMGMLKGPLTPMFLILSKLLVAIKDAVKWLAEFAMKQATEDKTYQKKMQLDPKMFGVNLLDKQGRGEYMTKRYEQAKEDSIHGLDGNAMMQEAALTAQRLGVKSAGNKGGVFDTMDQVEAYTRSENAMIKTSGATDSEVQAMKLQFMQIMNKGYADSMDIKPLMQSAPTIMAAIGKQLNLTNAQLMNSGRDKSLTGEMLRDAVIAMEKDNLALANAESMQTSEGQQSSGSDYMKSSMQSFSQAIDEAFVDNQVIFTFFKMLGDTIGLLGKDLFGVNEDMSTLSDTIMWVMFAIDVVVRSISIILSIIIQTVKSAVEAIYALFVVARNLLELIFFTTPMYVFASIGEAVTSIFSNLGDTLLDLRIWIAETIDGLARYIPGMDTVSKERTDDIAALKAQKSGGTERNSANLFFKDLAESSGARLDYLVLDTANTIATAGTNIKDNFVTAGENLASNMVGIERDMDIMVVRNHPNSKTGGDNDKNLEDINKNTSGMRKSAGKTLEVLREIAGYTVINRITRVRPNHIYNFGDIRTEGGGYSDVPKQLLKSMENAESRNNASGQQGNSDTTIYS